jgi:hypothetical protein
MKYICVTNIDAGTGIICTQEAMQNGPALPTIKGFIYNWENISAWPIACTPEGVYTEAPKYYGTCDDDADTDVVGLLEVMSKAAWDEAKRIEFEARKPYPSWVLENGEWVPPVPYPTDGNNYTWDEGAVNWK